MALGRVQDKKVIYEIKKPFRTLLFGYVNTAWNPSNCNEFETYRLSVDAPEDFLTGS